MTQVQEQIEEVKGKNKFISIKNHKPTATDVKVVRKGWFYHSFFCGILSLNSGLLAGDFDPNVYSRGCII